MPSHWTVSVLFSTTVQFKANLTTVNHNDHSRVIIILLMHTRTLPSNVNNSEVDVWPPSVMIVTASVWIPGVKLAVLIVIFWLPIPNAYKYYFNSQILITYMVVMVHCRKNSYRLMLPYDHPDSLDSRH